VLDHYVVFRARPGKEKEVAAALQDFGSAIEKDMPCLLEFTWGPNINQSGLDRGFTHGCFARLTTEASLKEEYWIHPAHQVLIGVLDDLCDERFALDYRVDDVIGAG
jgi:hypothetical protein